MDTSSSAPVVYKSKEWWEYFVIPLLVPLAASGIAMIIVCLKQGWLKPKLFDSRARRVQYGGSTQSPEFPMGQVGRVNNVVDEPPTYDAAIQVPVTPDKFNPETSFGTEIYTIESPPSYFMLQNQKPGTEPTS